jgi:hypothetical protein
VDVEVGLCIEKDCVAVATANSTSSLVTLDVQLHVHGFATVTT